MAEMGPISTFEFVASVIAIIVAVVLIVVLIFI